MSLDTWLIYFLTCWGIALVPGPNALLVLTHGAMYGQQKTLFTITGGVLGFIGMVSLCAMGLGALVNASVTWLTVLKIAGGLYLIWLGINLWRSEPIAPDVGRVSHRSGWSLFRQVFFSAVSNPKALLLYTAFIPPFLDPVRNVFVQTLIIALTYAVVEFAVECIIACTAHSVRPWLARSGRRFNKVCGGVLVLFGVLLPARS